MNRVLLRQLESMVSDKSRLQVNTSLISFVLNLPQVEKIHGETHRVTGGTSD